MKVIFVTRGWPTIKDPMLGNYEAVQAKALAKRGIDVTVAFLQAKSLVHSFESRVVKKRDEDGVVLLSTSVVLTELPGVGWMKFNSVDLWLRQRAFSRVYDYYRKLKGDADIIHAHIITFAHDCRLVQKRYGIPFVITEHWSKMNLPVLDKSILKRCEAYFWADKVICVSKALADSLKNKLGVNSQVVHNMVPDFFFEQHQLKNTSSKLFRFISVGSLVGIKGFDLLIKAFSNTKHLSECQLSIIGGGQEESHLQQLIEQCNMQDKVFLLGLKKPEEVGELLAMSDCFILTSHRETFGIVLIEAMAKGKPVIATACGGPESFVNECNGILIPVGNIDAATKAIDQMVEEINKYDSDTIRDYCYDNFSEEAIAQRIIEVYYELKKTN
jgi:glycosyltransferase involved in cell wall biosynthesis